MMLIVLLSSHYQKTRCLREIFIIPTLERGNDHCEP